MLQDIHRLAEGYMKRFPEGREPFQMTTRLLEECGEVAAEVSHWQGSRSKREKHGEPSKEKLAGEIKQSLAALMQIVCYYGIENELESSIQLSLARMKEEGLFD